MTLILQDNTNEKDSKSFSVVQLLQRCHGSQHLLLPKRKMKKRYSNYLSLVVLDFSDFSGPVIQLAVLVILGFGLGRRLGHRFRRLLVL